MRCSKCQSLYDAAVQGSLPEKAGRKVQEHLASCPTCAVFWQENQALRRLVRDTARPAAVPDADYFARMARRAVAAAEAEQCPPATAGVRWFDRLRAYLGGGRVASIRVAQAAALLVIGVAIGAVGTRSLRHPEMTRERDRGIARVPTPTPSAIDPRIFPWKAGFSPTDLLPPVSPDARSPDTVMSAEPGRIEKVPREGESDSAIELARARREALTVNPELVLEAWQGTVALLDKLGPTDEVERLRRLQQVSGQIKLATALTSLQDLKLQLVRNGQTEYIPVVHQIEGVLNQLALASPEAQASHFPQLETYQQAERALIEKRYKDAMPLFQMVVIHAPKSYLAARARYQMGNINFECFRDYENALFDYKRCLEEFPPHFLSESILRQIHDRVDLIVQNNVDGYAPLTFFHKAESAGKAADAVALYVELLRKYPKSPLVKPAIEAMTRIVRQAANDDRLVNQVLDALDQFQQEEPDHPFVLQAQLAMTDITHYPLRNLSQAQFDYSKILREAKDPALIQTVEERLRQLEKER